MILRLQEAHEVHSGYHLPISILKANPLHVETNFHNYHHVRNSGNFGSFFAIWDDILNTDKEYRKHVIDEQII